MHYYNTRRARSWVFADTRAPVLWAFPKSATPPARAVRSLARLHSRQYNESHDLINESLASRSARLFFILCRSSCTLFIIFFFFWNLKLVKCNAQVFLGVAVRCGLHLMCVYLLLLLLLLLHSKGIIDINELWLGCVCVCALHWDRWDCCAWMRVALNCAHIVVGCEGTMT